MATTNSVVFGQTSTRMPKTRALTPETMVKMEVVRAIRLSSAEGGSVIVMTAPECEVRGARKPYGLVRPDTRPDPRRVAGDDERRRVPAPPVGLEPTTLRLTAECSAN